MQRQAIKFVFRAALTLSLLIISGFAMNEAAPHLLAAASTGPKAILNRFDLAVYAGIDKHVES